MVGLTKVEDEFEDIGKRLRSAREAADLSVDDVVFRTRLPRSVVVALEANDFSVFTSPVYAKSFLAQYSEYLNVDAQPWLDALEPGSFMPGGLLHPLLEGPTEEAEVKAASQESRGGLLSILGLFGLTAAVVVGTIKGYEFFEKRFGGEGAPAVVSPDKAKAAEEVEIVEPPSEQIEKKVEADKEDEEIAQPPPRAIIVR